jgi:hypothetical protein
MRSCGLTVHASRKYEQSDETVKLLTLMLKARLSVRDRLREARMHSLANAEGFVSIVQTHEELGQLLRTRPILVVRSEDKTSLLGIITPFDLL